MYYYYYNKSFFFFLQSLLCLSAALLPMVTTADHLSPSPVPLARYWLTAPQVFLAHLGPRCRSTGFFHRMLLLTHPSQSIRESSHSIIWYLQTFLIFTNVTSKQCSFLSLSESLSAVGLMVFFWVPLESKVDTSHRLPLCWAQNVKPGHGWLF